MQAVPLQAVAIRKRQLPMESLCQTEDFNRSRETSKYSKTSNTAVEGYQPHDMTPDIEIYDSYEKRIYKEVIQECKLGFPRAKIVTLT